MKKKKDILFLCQFFYPEYISSATLPFDMAVALTKAGFSVGALCGYPKEYNLMGEVPLQEIHENISIRRLRYIQVKRGNVISRLINYLSFVFSVMLHFSELRKYKAIIVYSNPPILPVISALANKFFKTKVIFVSFDVYPEMAQITNSISANGIIRKMMEKANGHIFKHATKVVAISNEMKDYLLKKRTVLVDEQIEVIPNWCEDDKRLTNCAPVQQRFSQLKNENNIIVSYFGNMGICQDMDTILQTIRIAKDDNNIQFLFAGHGIKMSILKEAVQNEKLANVNIFDYLHGQDFIDALKVSDCFLVSLVEGLGGLCVPSKIYSYMTAGKPIIAIMEENFDVVKDLMENEAGFTVRQGDSQTLLEYITTLQAGQSLRKKMGENCRSIYLEKYTKAKCTEEYIDMIKKMLEE